VGDRVLAQPGVGGLTRSFAANLRDATDTFALRDAGGIRPTIGATYPLASAARIIRHLAERRAVGKVVVTV
jgi:NADPH2:quinone reductase